MATHPSEPTLCLAEVILCVAPGPSVCARHSASDFVLTPYMIHEGRLHLTVRGIVVMRRIADEPRELTFKTRGSEVLL